MSRVSLLAAVAFLVLAAASSRAADLPTGRWTVVLADAKGDLIIESVGRDAKVKATLLGGAVEGTWSGDTLSIKNGGTTLEAALVAEDLGKGQTKYTLTGFRTQRVVNAFTAPPLPAEYEVKTGWYAQKVMKEQGQITAEVKGTIVCKDITSAYVSVKRD